MANNRIVIDDGTKTYDITNKNGDVLGHFTINPSDSNILRRYDEVSQKLSEITVPEGEDAVRTVEDEIKKLFDYLFNANVSDDFFSIVGALSPLENGQLFFENVITAILSVLEKEFGTRAKKMQEHMSKYTAKYKK